MYEVESEALGFTLAPGRYALVWKGIGYDFVVAGDASSKHCLEHVTAVNGVFFQNAASPSAQSSRTNPCAGPSSP